MGKLIEALQIFLRYVNADYPTHCEHDVLLIMGVTKEQVSSEDRVRLEELGFHWMSSYNCWGSFRYGSA